MREARRLAPADMMGGYVRLNELAKELLGPQALVECDGGLFFLTVLPGRGPEESRRECLGANETHCEAVLREYARRWGEVWEHIAAVKWHQGLTECGDCCGYGTY